jgi:hypothetical protein
MSIELQDKYQNMIDSDEDFYNRERIIILSNFLFLKPFSKKVYIDTLSNIMNNNIAKKIFNDLIKYKVFELEKDEEYFIAYGYIPEEIQKELKRSINFNAQKLKGLKIKSKYSLPFTS